MAGIAPARESFGRTEVELAFRNHGGFIEALKSDITPTGMHYLLVHYDVPLLDAATHTLHVEGHVRNKLTLSLDDLKRMPKVSLPVTLECAGDGRSFYTPRRESVPWGHQAFGTAVWGGVRLRSVLELAGVLESAVEICTCMARRR